MLLTHLKAYELRGLITLALGQIPTSVELALSDIGGLI